MSASYCSSRILRWCWPAVLVAAVLQAAPAGAVLVVGDHPNFGVGKLTTDTATGLQWLDVTHTLFVSYNTMITLFDPGDTFEGWRHATAAEVATLFTNGGISPLNAGVSGVNPTLFTLQQTIGYVGLNPPNHVTFGHIANPAMSGSNRGVASLWQVDPNNVPGGENPSWSALDGLTATAFYLSPDLQATATGHFLVRPVPEASSFLFASAVGVAGASAACIRRRRALGAKCG